MDAPFDINPLTVLLVEDNATFARAVLSFLALIPAVHVVGHASCGPQAIALTLQHKPHVALLDISLGGMSGFDVARHLRTLDNPPAMVFLTMHDQTAYRQQATAVGAQGYVLKEYFVDQLPALLVDLRSAHDFA